MYCVYDYVKHTHGIPKSQLANLLENDSDLL